MVSSDSSGVIHGDAALVDLLGSWWFEMCFDLQASHESRVVLAPGGGKGNHSALLRMQVATGVSLVLLEDATSHSHSTKKGLPTSIGSLLFPYLAVALLLVPLPNF